MARNETARERDKKKDSLLDRRSYLKLAGATAASVASFGTTASAAGSNSLILEESFEDASYEDWFTSSWVQGSHDSVSQKANHTGNSSMRVNIAEGNHHGMKAKVDPKDAGLVDKNMQEMYVSYWVKFSPNFTSSSNGGKLPGPVNRERNSGGPAGEPADGTNGWGAHGKFGANDQGIIVGYYTYHMDMDGTWGEHIVADTVPRDEWVHIEQYVKLNTVTNGSANPDGTLKMWVNGELGIDRTNMRYTLYPENGINYDMVIYYGGSEPSPANNHLYIDDWKIAPSRTVSKPNGDALELVSNPDTTGIEYEFTVDGSVSKNTYAGDKAAEGNDTITDNNDGTMTVTGISGHGKGDSYIVNGMITSMNIDESKWTIRYQGKEMQVRDIVKSPAPTIDRFDLSTSQRLGNDRMFSVNWAVSDEDGNLDVVEVSVVNGTTNTNFSVNDVSGKKASDWELFQFPSGSELDVYLRAKDTAGNVTKKTKTINL